MTFLLSEDEALRNLLKDMTVTDQKSVTEAGATRGLADASGAPEAYTNTGTTSVLADGQPVQPDRLSDLGLPLELF